MQKYKINRACIINGTKLKKGEVIDGPAWIVDIAVKLGYAEEVKAQKKKSVTEE